MDAILDSGGLSKLSIEENKKNFSIPTNNRKNKKKKGNWEFQELVEERVVWLRKETIETKILVLVSINLNGCVNSQD